MSRGANSPDLNVTPTVRPESGSSVELGANADSILYGDHVRSSGSVLFSQMPNWFPNEIAYSQLFTHADYYWERHHGFVGTSGWAVKASTLEEALSRPEAYPDAITGGRPVAKELLRSIRKIDPLELYTQELTRVSVALALQSERPGKQLMSLVNTHVYRYPDPDELDPPSIHVQVPGGDIGKANIDQVAFLEQTLKGQGQFMALRAKDQAPNGFLLKLDDDQQLLGYVRFDFIEY